VIRHVINGEKPFPLIVHAHGAAFMGWLVLLTVQLLLIRNRRIDLHRKLGIAGAVLASIMVPLGVATALTIQRMGLGQAGSQPEFFSVQLIDMIEFGGLAAAAIAARKLPSAHKRLILLATLSIADAGFARWLGVWLYGYLGEGTWQFFAELFGGSAAMILLLGAYDWTTRRRLHPAYVFGASWIFAGQLSASWLFHQPGWKALATSVIRLWPFS
jgi:hypothetical protein